MKSKEKWKWFCDGVLTHIDFYSKYSFLLGQQKIEKHRCEMVFVYKDKYLKFVAADHPKEYPHYLNIILGRGSLKFPECDWNGVAIWRMKRYLEPYGNAGEYKLEEDQLQKAILDLKVYGIRFLECDVSMFNEVLKIQNDERRAYEINFPSGDGHYFKIADLESSELKRKFSQ